MHFDLNSQTDLQQLDHAFIKDVIHSVWADPSTDQSHFLTFGDLLKIKIAPDVPASTHISHADFTEGLGFLLADLVGEPPRALTIDLIYDEKGAYLRVKSEAEQGTVRQFTLNFTLDADVDFNAVIPDVVKDAGWSSLAPLTLLVVDDDAVNRTFFQTLFTVHGHQVTLAENGGDAVDRLKRTTELYDVILMDVEMPVMKGTVAAEKIRQLPGPISEIPIIGLTAHTDPSVRDACLGSGMVSVFTKPLEEKKCAAELQRILSAHE